jgi:hypothetical protein
MKKLIDDTEPQEEDGGDDCGMVYIDGTDFAWKVYTVGANRTPYYELFELQDVEVMEKGADGKRKKTGEIRREFKGGIYPSSFAHMAEVISRKIGATAPTVVATIKQIVTERKKLEDVLTEIIKFKAGKK